MSQIISTYLKELKNDHSTNDQTIDLIIRTREGDCAAKERLIKNYLLFVVKIANNYKNMGVPLADVISEGNIGLMNAIEKFDLNRGSSFSTCAHFWIKQSIIRNCMHKRRLIKLPENISELIRAGRWSGNAYQEVSIDSPNDEGDSMSESIADVESSNIFTKEEDMLLKLKAENILSFLSFRDAAVMKAYYGIDRNDPLEPLEISKEFNLTSTRINQILRDSLHKLRVNCSNTPEYNVKKVEIVSAIYGANGRTIDVTDKVTDMHLNSHLIKVSNKLGGDPYFGIKKTLVIQFIHNEELHEKTFMEGKIVNF